MRKERYVVYTALRNATADGSELISLRFAYKNIEDAHKAMRAWCETAITYQGYELYKEFTNSVLLERDGEILKVAVQSCGTD